MTEPTDPLADAAAFIRDDVTRWVEQANVIGSLDLNHPKCRVCRDDTIRSLVNKMLARSFSSSDILEVLESHNRKCRAEGRGQITYNSLYNHQVKHFNAQEPAAAVLRQIQENRALEGGKDLRTAVGNILTPQAFLESVMARAYEGVADLETPVPISLGATAAAKLYEIAKESEGQMERAQMLATMGRLVSVVREFVPSEHWPALQARLRGEAPPEEDKETTTVDSVRVVNIADDSEDM